LLNLPSTDFWKSFDIFIQLGAILAIVMIYFSRVWKNKKLIGKILTAFLPTAFIGLTVYKIIKQFFLGNSNIVLFSLLIGGLLIICFEKFQKNTPDQTQTKLEDISYFQAFKIGLFQSLAVIPGVSRSAATILGGLWIGVEKTAIVEFSFLLAIPTMAAASGLDILKSGFTFSSEEWLLLGVGFIISFFTAWLAVKFLLSYIQKNNFTIFGWYRVAVALIGFWILK